MIELRKTVKTENDEVLQSLPVDKIYVINVAHLTLIMVDLTEFRNKLLTIC
jgi:hypothetical protein